MLLARKDLSDSEALFTTSSSQKMAKSYSSYSHKPVDRIKVKKRKERDNFEEILVSNKSKTHEVKLFSL